MRDILETDVESFLGWSGVKPTNLSKAAVNNPSWYGEFRKGAGIRTRNYDRIRATISGYRAACQGLDLCDVPYKVPTQIATSWANGFKLYDNGKV